MDMKGKICPYCKTALDDSETIVVCDTCDMPHHLTCWQENQGCTTFGCTGAIGAIIDGNKQKSHPTERLGTMPQSREPAGASGQAPFTRAQKDQVAQNRRRPEQQKPMTRGNMQPIVRPAASTQSVGSMPKRHNAAQIQEMVLQQSVPVKAPVLEVLREDIRSVVQENSPVLLEKIVLLIDRMQDQLFARCIFRSLAVVPVRALQVRIRCQDVWGETEEEYIQYQYIDVNAGFGMQFGQDVTIPLRKGSARRVQVIVLKVLLADETVITCGEKSVVLPEPITLQQYLRDNKLVQEYASITVPGAWYVPQDAKSIWRCTCGAVNTSNSANCCTCGVNVRQAFEALDIQKLQERVFEKEEALRLEQELAIELEEYERTERIRLEEEEKQRALAYQEELEREERRKKRRRRIETGVILTISLLAVATCVGIFAVRPYYEYSLAQKALKDQRYEEAYERFVALEYYSDSERMAKEALYQQATSMKENGEFDAAIAVLEQISDYRDSSEMTLECRYGKGVHQVENGEYVDAVNTFQELGEYSDSTEKVREAQRAYINAHKNNKDETTYRYLTELKNSQDADAIMLYKELYAWEVKILGWSKSADDDTYIDKVKRKEKVYCHFVVMGGVPNEKLSIEFSAELSDKTITNAVNMNSEPMGDGERGVISFEEGVSQSGVLKVTIKDASNTFLCDGSIAVER